MDLLALGATKEPGLVKRIESYRSALIVDGNEAQTRFHVIDEILRQELDWHKDATRVEPYIEGSGYADYALFAGLRCRVVLEAKRDDAELCKSRQNEIAVIPLSSSALSAAKEGIDQAIRYSSRFGAPIGIVTNGRQWIGFHASRSDGLAPLDGHAVVFPCTEAIVKNWSNFFEFFSDFGLQEGRLSNFLRQKEMGVVPVLANYYRAFDRSYKKSLNTSELSYLLEDVFHSSFVKMSNQSSDMLVECFVESKSSREADVGFQKIVDELIGKIKRVQQIDSAQPAALQDLLESSVELRTGEFVLLVGNKGAGKTTFLQRFFQKVVSKATKDKSLVLNVNLLKSEGSLERLTDWISHTLIDQAERALYGTSTPTYDALRGTFWNRYTRMKRGELAPLYEKDPDAFRQRFGEELREFRTKQPREYLLSLLKNALVSRRLLPVLVIDNVDHLHRDMQDTVFQYAIGISSSVTSFLVCPVTDTTVWSLSKAGPLQSFHSRAFFLPVPSLKDVFAKRLEVLRANPILAEAASKRASGVVGQGMKLQISDLESFCATVESIFVATSEITTLIGRLCNFDVRRSLELAGSVLASPWIGIEQLLRLYVAQGGVTPRRTELLNALVLQKGTLFDEDKHGFVMNVFARPPGTISSPLMSLYVLKYLMIIDEHASATSDKFVSVSDLWTLFSAINVPRETFRHFVERLFSRAMLESYDPSEKILRDETLIRVSPAGSAHYRLTFSDPVYLSQMALVTYLESEMVAIELREEAQREHVGWMKMSRIFVSEIMAEDSRLITVETSGIYSWIGAVRQEMSLLLERVSVRRENNYGGKRAKA